MYEKDPFSQVPQDPPTPPIEVPKEALSQEALDGIIDNFIVREGTDYGWEERSYDSKKADLLRQLDKGKILITFDPNTETVSLMTRLEGTNAHALNHKARAHGLSELNF